MAIAEKLNKMVFTTNWEDSQTEPGGRGGGVGGVCVTQEGFT